MADLEASARGKTASLFAAPKAILPYTVSAVVLALVCVVTLSVHLAWHRCPDVSDKVLCDMIFNYQIAHTQREVNREQHCARLLKLARLAEKLEADEWRFQPVEKLLGFSNQS